MRLINVHSLQLETFLDERKPPYYILSHTWEDGELSLQEFMIGDENVRRKPGYAKIEWTCHMASRDGVSYAWVDTCCIDKTDSTDLTEAINSMFKWYQEAAICVVFLSDLPHDHAVGIPDTDTAVNMLSGCRWFTRGWTLQELIASKTVRFYDAAKRYRFERTVVDEAISKITGIHLDVFSGRSLHTFSVAERMSWASSRMTTRPEDIAYCLLGIMDVHMPQIYGEGSTKAFIRLQHEIIRSIADTSILAWSSKKAVLTFQEAADELDHTKSCFPVLAPSPKYFQLGTSFESTGTEMAITNIGIRVVSNGDVHPYQACLKGCFPTQCFARQNSATMSCS